MRLETHFPVNRRCQALALAFVSALVALPAVVNAAGEPAPSVSLAWNPNPEPDVAGYKVHFGTQSGVYSDVIDVRGATSIALPQMLMGSTYYLAVSAYNAAGQEGPRSSEFSVTAAVPSSPALSTTFAFGGTSQGQGALQWKYPKSAAGSASGFKVYASEDLQTWAETAEVDPSQPASSDSEWLYFNHPYQATKSRMFFRVAAGNAFGQAE
jgi:hypothetical protein